jgi:hypothetical protein
MKQVGSVAVVGASEKPWRYANRALRMLVSHGFRPVPVSRFGKNILDLKGYVSLADIPGRIDTVSMYLSPERQPPVIRDILAVRPRRVIFNPGAENPDAASILRRHGISVEEACTLVLLATGQF